VKLGVGGFSNLRGLESRVGVGRVRRFLSYFDWPLFAALVLILAIGLLNLYSATFRIAHVEGAADHSNKFDRQVTWVAIGMVLYLGITLLDYRNLTRIAWLALGGAIALTLIVFVLGSTAKGAQRWIGFGFARIQPSELAKIAVILAIARLVQDRDFVSLTLRQQIVRWIAIGSPVLLVAAQPDLGSGILIFLIILSIGYLTFSNLLPLVGTSIVALAALPLVWEIMHDYQKRRVLAFLDPSDASGDAWHTRQSIFAVGSGRVLGKGFMEGTQNQFSFLPEQWTDFPFSVWAEEWGLVGSIALLSLYGFLIFWVVNVGLGARDRFGAVICIGVAAMLFWHVIVNICMVLGLAPVVGVTLPLVSYGGSSVLTFFIGLGLVSSVAMRRHGY
jgi:rod shape determining protein RodA